MVSSSSRKTLLRGLDSKVVLSVHSDWKHPQFRRLYFHPKARIS